MPDAVGRVETSPAVPWRRRPVNLAERLRSFAFSGADRMSGPRPANRNTAVPAIHSPLAAAFAPGVRALASGSTWCAVDKLRVHPNTCGELKRVGLAGVVVRVQRRFVDRILQPIGRWLGITHDKNATLAWDAPRTNTDGTPLTDLAGYRVYSGRQPGVYDTPLDVGLVTTVRLENLNVQPGETLYFAVTAYDVAGNESVYSNEASKYFR